MATDDGGAVFPGHYENEMGKWTDKGTSLRDLFAGIAKLGLLVSATKDDMVEFQADPDAFGHDIAKAAYRFADTMLAERKE